MKCSSSVLDAHCNVLLVYTEILCQTQFKTLKPLLTASVP